MRQYDRKIGMRLVVAFCVSASLAAGRSMAEEKAEAQPDTKDVKVRDVKLTVPKSWKQEQPSSRFRAGQFVIPSPAKQKKKQEGKAEDGSADLVIYYFGGGGGGVQANINRWIGQFETKDRQVKVSVGKAPQGKYVVVDVSGTYNQPVGPPIQRKTKPLPDARMLAVILAIEGKGNYFLKLTGPQKIVSAATKDFRRSFGAEADKEEVLQTSEKKEQK